MLRKFANKYQITGTVFHVKLFVYFPLQNWKFETPCCHVILQHGESPASLSLRHNEAGKLKCVRKYKSFRARTFCCSFILRDMRCGTSFPIFRDVKERRSSFIPTFRGTLCVMNFESLHPATRMHFTAVIKFKIFGVVAFLWTEKTDFQVSRCLLMRVS